MSQRNSADCKRALFLDAKRRRIRRNAEDAPSEVIVTTEKYRHQNAAGAFINSTANKPGEICS